MPNVTSDDARRDFGRILEDARRDPVFVFDDGKPAAVVLSWDAFTRVIAKSQSAAPASIVADLLPTTIERHRELFAALAKLD